MKANHFLIVLLIVAGCHVTDAPQSISPAYFSGKPKLDSLLYVASTAAQDTNLAKLYSEIGDEYVYHYHDFQKAKEYFLKSKELSEKLNWNAGHYRFAVDFADILNLEGLMDSSVVILQQALNLAKNEMNERQAAIISMNLGNSYLYKRWFETALTYYHEAIPVLEKRGEKFTLAHLFDLMGVVYGYMDMYDENLVYAERALEIFNEKPDTLPRAFALNNYALGLLKRNELEKAENSLMQAQRIFALHHDRYHSISIFSNLADIALRKYDLDKAEMYYRKMMELNLEFGHVEGQCKALRGFGIIELYRGKFHQSDKHVREALKIAMEYDLPEEKIQCYKLLSDLATALHDFRNYRLYAAKTDSIRNRLISEKTRQYAKEVEAKYETEKKQQRITILEQEKRLTLWLAIAIVVVLLLALTFLFFLWRWTVQKRAFAETRIRQLEQEKRLVAAQSLLDGEIRERTRLTRDLHDGLGSILAGAKLNLLKMKKGDTLEDATLEDYEAAVRLLDKSMSEMRRIAHHLMPEALISMGLKHSTADFIGSIPHATFSYYGDESRFDPKLEESIYRIIHELVTNSLKHSGAEHILVEIVRYDNHITFTVQDNGCGFDPETTSKGMGMNNIRIRVETYNGNLMIYSKPDIGTEVNVEFKL